MQLRTLKAPVVQHGPTIIGLPSCLTLAPTPDGLSGWWWRFSPSMSAPIIARALKVARHSGYRFLYLESQDCNHRINVIEHPLALHWMGLTNIQVSNSLGAWMPFTAAIETWDVIKESGCLQNLANDNIRWVTVKYPYSVTHDRVTNGELTIHPRYEPGLELEVSVDYPNVGKGSKTVIIGTDDDSAILEAMQAYSIAWPTSQKPLARLASLVLRWPHLRHFTWADECSAEDFIRIALDHRILDLAGALATCTSDGHSFLAATIRSHGSGHLEDARIARYAYTNQLLFESHEGTPRHTAEEATVPGWKNRH
jgi:UDP-3-O-acyl-N-acetylglucosamine deacetylase